MINHCINYFLNASDFQLRLVLLFIFIWCSPGCTQYKNDSMLTLADKHYTPAPTPAYISNQQKTTPLMVPNIIHTQALLIKAQSSQLKIQPSLVNKTLILGNSRIEHWPLGLPICQPCDLKIKQVFHPDGPDILLRLTNGGTPTPYQWGVLQTNQKLVYLLGAKLYFEDTNKLKMDYENQKFHLKIGSSYSIKNCRIKPIWIETFSPLPPHYSDDQAKHKIQISFECH
jgi:hypothetical protein